ncbi:MAG TPA: hypothetical protein VK052_03870 [Zeimonas sp.]|nr:hypothetical protein [Zeimonas sp.]
MTMRSVLVPVLMSCAIATPALAYDNAAFIGDLDLSLVSQASASSRSRAEVLDELRQAQLAGAVMMVDFAYPVAPAALAPEPNKTRAQVRAELRGFTTEDRRLAAVDSFN